MSVLGFVFLIIITTLINIFVTAFLIARSQYSQKVMQRLQREAHSIIRTVNKATEEHIVIAESTIVELEKLLGDYKRLSRSAKTQVSKVQKLNENSPTRTHSTTSTKRVKKDHAPLVKKQSAQPEVSVQNAIVKMLEDGKSDTYIREHLSISKAELALAKFMHTSKK